MIQVYDPTCDADDDEIDKLFEGISAAQKEEKTHFTIVIGDLKANIDTTSMDNILNSGNHRVRVINTKGEKL